MRRHDVVVLIFFIYVSRVTIEPIGDADDDAGADEDHHHGDDDTLIVITSSSL